MPESTVEVLLVGSFAPQRRTRASSVSTGCSYVAQLGGSWYVRNGAVDARVGAARLARGCCSGCSASRSYGRAAPFLVAGSGGARPPDHVGYVELVLGNWLPSRRVPRSSAVALAIVMARAQARRQLVAAGRAAVRVSPSSSHSSTRGCSTPGAVQPEAPRWCSRLEKVEGVPKTPVVVEPCATSRPSRMRRRPDSARAVARSLGHLVDGRFNRSRGDRRDRARDRPT